MYSIYTEQQNKGNKLRSNWAPVASRFKSPWLGWVHRAPRLHHPPWFASSPFSVVPASSSSFSPSRRFAHLLPVSLFLHVFSTLPHRRFPHLCRCVRPPTHPRGCLTLRIRPSVTSSPLPLSSSPPLPLLLLLPCPCCRRHHFPFYSRRLRSCCLVASALVVVVDFPPLDRENEPRQLSWIVFRYSPLGPATSWAPSSSFVS